MHGIGKDETEAKDSVQSRETTRLLWKYLWITENVADII